MKRTKHLVLAIYCLLFFAVWAFYELVMAGKLDILIPNTLLRRIVTDGIIKNLVWTLPALLLLRHFPSEVFVEPGEMFAVKTDWRPCLLILAGFSLYLAAGAILQKGTLAISESFDMADMVLVLFVGLTEETVFRGWLLNATYREEKKWRCIFLNAVMFLAIHFPIWIHSGVFVSSFADFSFVCILALSVIFSLAFLKSRRIWVPVFLHMYWDLLVLLLY